MNFNVEERTILLVRHGSHAYGLNTPESDVDEKGVCIPPKPYYFGFLHHFEQQVCEAKKGHPADSTIYSLSKFVSLAADCNPNIIEILHVEDEDVLKVDRFGERLREHRDLFISKKAAQTFTGYAWGQIKRMRRHREWLLNPPKKQPAREDFGLHPHVKLKEDNIKAAMAAVTRKLQHWNFEDMSDLDPATRILIQNTMAEIEAEMGLFTDEKFRAAARSLGIEENFTDILTRERAYKAAMDNWNSYLRWQKERNPARAALEAKCGYDGKHMSHCKRLLRMCVEILKGLGVNVKRTWDRDELIELKRGNGGPYEQEMEEAMALMTLIKDELVHTSTIPANADLLALEALVQSMTEEYLSLYR